eukprot:2634320-Alexandrium_andersonii.AAC.1
MSTITALQPEDLTIPRSDCEARGWVTFGYRPGSDVPLWRSQGDVMEAFGGDEFMDPEGALPPDGGEPPGGAGGR